MSDPQLSPADTAWLLTATALVLFMTIPGLALFYGGLVRSKNVLSVLMQCLGITALVTVLWVAFGYSLAFDRLGLQVDTAADPTFLGGISKLFLRGGNQNQSCQSDAALAQMGWTVLHIHGRL